VSPIDFFKRELAPSHRRFVEAARNATKTTITTGLAATMQTLGPFGPLFAFRIGQPGISLGLFEGALVIATAAVVQAAIVPITGELLDYPGLILAFVFLVFTAVGYLLSATPRLFLILALVAVGTITTVYVGLFEPGQIGWGSTYTFDGILIATLVMVALDTSIWPSPPEPRLLESLATAFERARRRLVLIGQRYREPIAAPLPPPEVISTLAPNLALLESVKEHTKPPPKRFTALLDSAVTAERIHQEVERIATLADEPVTGEIRQVYRVEIEKAFNDLDEAIAERTDHILSGLLDSSAERAGNLRETIRHLDDLIAQISVATHEQPGSERSNLLGCVGGLMTMASLLEPRDTHLVSSTSEASTTEDDFEPSPLIDPTALRFSIKLAATITLGLVVGLTTQRADIQTILWSIAVVGQPNQYGAVVRKTLLRLGGCVIGGLAALAAMILVSENFDSLPAYLVVIFAVTMVSTYVAQSDEWLGYAGIQAGITFLICYVGVAPTTDVYKPLWRFWGIVLGVLTAAFVFLFLFPEQASDKLIERLDKLLRTVLTFGKEVTERRITEEGITAIDRRLSTNLLDVLNMADQARLEGQRGAISSVAAIEAAYTLARIGYRFEVIARGRIAEPKVLQHEQLSEREVAFEQACCAALEIQIAKLEPSDSLEHLAQTSPTQTIDLGPISDELAAVQNTLLPPDDQILLTAQFESYRRLPILLSSLDTSLSRIAASIAKP
jgi:uncharacterized membrane protein YccC